MKILQLCNKVPYPPKDGGCMAMNNLTYGLTEAGCSVKVLAINTKKHFEDIENLPSSYRDISKIEAVFVDTEVNIVDAFSNLFTNKSYNIERFYSKAFEDKLVELLKANNFDVVHVESLYVSMYIDVIRAYSNAKVVLRAHNVEHKLWEYNAQLTTNPTKKIYFELLAKRLKEYELKSVLNFDAIVAITDEDASFFKKNGFSKPILTAPFGVNTSNYFSKEGKGANSPFSAFHIGSMDWQHNVEGINWLLNKVWDKVLNLLPQFQLLLAGRNMSKQILNLSQKNVNVVGEVDDAIDFMLSNGIMLVPLLSGSGMRVKIIEGMALGKTIISSSIGAEGIEYENGKNIIIADTAEEFALAIHKCVSNPDFYASVGKNARQLVKDKYDNKKICEQVTTFYKELIAR